MGVRGKQPKCTVLQPPLFLNSTPFFLLQNASVLSKLTAVGVSSSLGSYILDFLALDFCFKVSNAVPLLCFLLTRKKSLNAQRNDTDFVLPRLRVEGRRVIILFQVS